MHLQIRKMRVSQDLVEARKQRPRLEKAAQFVEGIYGRPLQSNPQVVNVPLMPFVSAGGKVLSTGFMENIMPRAVVHELTHSEDIKGMAAKGWKERLKLRFDFKRRIYLEGRAVFAEHLYIGKPKRFDMHFTGMVVGAVGAVALGIAGTSISIPIALMTIGAAYWLFNNALCTIANKIGDPIKAFRITSERIPSWKGLIFPLQYYREEIAKVEAEKIA
ncbi:MAG: hypothetical protein ABII22_03365 [Candidatus Micrarchaeota archaeon]